MKYSDEAINPWKLPYPMFKCTPEEVAELWHLLTRPEAFQEIEHEPFLCNLLVHRDTEVCYALRNKVQASCGFDSFATLDNYLIYKLGIYAKDSWEQKAYKRWIWIIKLINHNRGKHHAKTTSKSTHTLRFGGRSQGKSRIARPAHRPADNPLP